MAGQIKISPDTMRTRAQEYSNEADNVQQVISKMDSLLSALQSEWEGESSQSYSQRYQELKPGFEKAEELIREISQSLQKTATHLEETDAAIAGAFRG